MKLVYTECIYLSSPYVLQLQYDNLKLPLRRSPFTFLIIRVFEQKRREFTQTLTMWRVVYLLFFLSMRLVVLPRARLNGVCKLMSVEKSMLIRTATGTCLFLDVNFPLCTSRVLWLLRFMTWRDIFAVSNTIITIVEIQYA